MISAAASAFGQACPKSSQTEPWASSEVRTLEGKLVFHDGLQPWFELKFDKTQCGQASIELIQAQGDPPPPMEVFRGCRVRSRGEINFSTNAIKREMYQNPVAIESVGECKRQLPFPDYSKVKPDQAIHEYRVDMQVRPHHPIVFRVTSAGKELRPWRVYASYITTGSGFLLYGSCAAGFGVDKVFGTPEARPSHSEDDDEVRGTAGDPAMFDLDRASEAGKLNPQLGYTCVRESKN
jgi:hypothetical protein